MKRLPYATGLGLLFLATASAFAADGYVTRSTSLRAGPDSGYPSVARLHAGEGVFIEGCVDGWSWCDVSSRDDRGWINGNYLQEEYEGRRVLVPSYGVQIGIPVITFVFGSYWDDHYRHRSWYSNREHWSHVQPQYYSNYTHGDARPNSYDRSHDSTRADVHQSDTTVYRGTDQSRHTGAAAAHHTYESGSTTVTPQHEARQARSVDSSSHARQVERTAPATAPTHREAHSISEHNGSPTGPAQHGDRGGAQPRQIVEHNAPADRPSQQPARGADQPKVIAEHKARAPNPARPAQENPAHDRGNGHERANGKDNPKDEGKDNGKDKQQN